MAHLALPPLVAGIAALVISANPGLSALEVISILQRTASKDLDLTPYPKTPPSSFDSNPSWDISPVSPHDSGQFQNIGHPDGTWSPWFGFGKVDAEAAILEAIRLLGNSGGVAQPIVVSTNPNMDIPDNNASGISSKIDINQTGIVSQITVDLDIQHTYIGDLLITLLNPQGQDVILHNRSGGSANNLVTSYDTQNTPLLNNLAGGEVQGEWLLQVKDLANVDQGKLVKWGLSIDIQNQNQILVEELPGIAIPDANPSGIERTLQTNTSGTIQGITVDLDITHTYIGDLIINLISPQNSVIILHNRGGGNQDNIIKTYSPNNLPQLQDLKGENLQGSWRLQIQDVVGQDVGKLNRWGLKIDY